MACSPDLKVGAHGRLVGNNLLKPHRVEFRLPPPLHNSRCDRTLLYTRRRVRACVNGSRHQAARNVCNRLSRVRVCGTRDGRRFAQGSPASMTRFARNHFRYGTRRTNLLAVIVLVTMASLAVAHDCAAQDSLAAARDLYNAAQYENALVRLDDLRGSRPAAVEVRAIEEYRAFCLLALGRTAEAERAMEAVVTAAPSYRPTGVEQSPRVRAAFSDVRRRILPRIIQERYAQAKTALDRRDTASATAGFQQVLDLLADPDLTVAVEAPPLAELRTLAAGFRELSAPIAPPRPPSPPPAAPPTAREHAPRRAAPRIYGFEDAGVVPPGIVRESWAALADVFAVRVGVIELVIDETGAVASATMTTAVNAVYDRLAVATARRWRYRPATLDGAPVKFRKVIVLDLSATR